MPFAALIQAPLARLKPSDRRALLLVALFLTVVAGYVYLLEPLLFRYEQAQQALADLTEQQRRYTRQVTLLARREAKLAEHRAELAALNRHFKLEAVNPEAAVSRGIAELSYYARLTNAIISATRPLETQASAGYVEVPLEAEATGTYETLHKLLYYIDTSPSLLAITDLDLNAQAQGLLQARLKLSAITRAQTQDAAAPAALLARENRLQLVISQWTGYAPLIVAKRNGYLDTEELRVDFLSIDDKVTVERLLVSGEVDGVGISLPELLGYWTKGLPLKVILPLDSSAGTEGIVVRPDSPIKTVADLRQHDVAVDQQGILQFVLLRALTAAGLSLSDIQIQALDAGQVARDMASGTLEAGLTREPFLSALLASQQARLIYASDDLRGLILDLLAVTPEAIVHKAAAVQFLVEGLLKAQRFIAEQPERALEIIVDWEGQPSDLTRASLAKVELFDAPQTRAFFDPQRIAELLQVFEGYFQTTQQPFPLITHQDIVDGSFFDKADGEK